MARIVVRFFDDETVEGVARDLDFDEPDFVTPLTFIPPVPYSAAKFELCTFTS